jgi:hypothetical protein
MPNLALRLSFWQHGAMQEAIMGRGGMLCALTLFGFSRPICIFILI